ncbi:MAG: hypothetical protein AAF639_21605 [Chloroflexota bacterium]
MTIGKGQFFNLPCPTELCPTELCPTELCPTELCPTELCPTNHASTPQIMLAAQSTPNGI